MRAVCETGAWRLMAGSAQLGYRGSFGGLRMRVMAILALDTLLGMH